MRRICDRAGVKRFGFHAIRHLSASILYGLGYDVATIQAILRHRSPNTTERYLKTLGVEDIRRAMEDLSRQRAKMSPLVPMEERCEWDFMKEKPFEKPSTSQTARARLVCVK
ncbi:MAG: tyrosine-type recombinase/integrase [Deltaproteobacteria bacterium]|nr:tyrosine-type recombinase/integrase [Deltaproteobacteria bacterium]